MELRPLREADLASLATWLPATAAAIGCERWATQDALRDVIGKDNALTTAEGPPESFVAYRAGTPRHDASQVELLAVAPERRRLGLGGRTALALEERVARSASHLYVLVPANLGLTLYFWLRLGYRPLTQRAWPAQPESGPAVWMVRTLA